ncbi:MAG: hypothetical protein PHV06_05695, partial [bacterium]|nr:hypothetical protein [bacterium]
MKIFEIKKQEIKPIILMFLFLVILSCSIIIAENTRNAIYITELGIENYPYMYILNAVFLIFGIFLYTKFLERLERVRFSTIIMFIFSLSLISSSFISRHRYGIPVLAVIIEMIDN